MIIGNVVKKCKNKPMLLQILKGCVMAFSFYQLHPNATKCIRIRKVSDDAEIDVGFKNGYLDVDVINKFLNGVTTAGIVTWYNQARDIDKNDMTQADKTLQPVWWYGANMSRGIVFDGAAKYMTITPYAAMNLYTEPINFYANFYKNDTGTSKYIICKNTEDAASRQYGMYADWISSTKNRVTVFFDGSSRSSNFDAPRDPSSKVCARWQANTVSTWRIFQESNYVDTTASFGYGGYTISVTGAMCYVGCRGNTGGTVSNWFPGQIKTLLMFSTRQSRRMWDEIKKAGV
jgi:hypothetical protein